MNAGKAVYGILSANSGVTDLVGTRIFPEIAEQEAATPFIVYQLLSVDPEDTHDGPSKLDEVRFEFLCYADTYDTAADVGVKVRAALDRVSGTYNGVNVESVQFNDVDIEIEYQPRRYSQVLKFTFRIKRDDVTIALGTPVTGAVLGDLSDVDVDGVTNGQLIAYNSTSGNWEAADDAGGAETIGALNDVSVTLPADREALIYDGGNWVNDNISKTDVGLGNVDNTSDADKPVSSATQTALDAKADTSAVPTELNDLSDVTIAGTPAGNEALIYDTATSSFKSLPNFTNRFEDEAENNKQSIVPFAERVYTVKADGDGIFIDAQSDTPTAGKVIVRKIYQKAGFLENGDVIGDFTLIHTFADDTAYSATTSTFEGFRDGDTYGTPPFTLIQTWEEQTAAPAFTGLLNESYGSGAAAAYSVRRLNGLYTGSAIQVERSSDNTTQDIGFDSNGDLDESALTTFCTGTTCRVRTWYDQATAGGTGSGNDAVQTTHANQPTIYTGGAIVKENGRVALNYEGSQSLYSSGVSIAASMDVYHTTKKDTTTRQAWFAFDASVNTNYMRQEATSEQILFQFTDGFNFAAFGNAPASNRLTQNLYNANATSGAQEVRLNGVSLFTDTDTYSATGISGLYIGVQNNGANDFDGKYQEFIIYDSVKNSTDRTSIESNIGDYFTQNTPLLDTYTGAAAAYSLRKLRSAFSGSAIRVRRASDNTEQDIGFNVFGELDTVSLASFCSGTDGFVKTWYDQSGNTNDATQTNTANQPKIYDSSTGVVTDNNKPAISYDNTDLLESALAIAHVPLSVFIVQSGPATQADIPFNLGNTTSGLEYTRLQSNAPSVQQVVARSIADGIAAANAADDFDQGLITIISKAINDRNIGVNGGTFVNLSTSVTTIDSNYLKLGGQPTEEIKQQDVIVYASDQSSNRTNIEDNINTFYSIY